MNDSHQLSTKQVSDLANSIYAGGSSNAIRWVQKLRPYICPFQDILSRVPAGSRVLDVGCGAGLFLMLLAKLSRIQSGFGFDISRSAIGAAQEAAERNNLTHVVQFGFRAADAGLPPGEWGTISALDVLHHVPRPYQHDFVRSLCKAVPQQGYLIIKDMVTKPRWRAAANQMHDLIMARQIINHVAADTVESWANAEGLTTTFRNQTHMLWYGHWTLVLQRQ